MTIKTFIDEYKNASNKDAFIQKHIVNQYVAFARKSAMCEQLAKKTTHSYVTVNGEDREIYKEDSVNRYILLMMLMIQEYTDIDAGAMTYEEFSLLDEYAIPDKVHQNIPERERSQWETLLRMYIDDIRCNERDLIGWLDDRMDTARLAITSLLNAVSEVQGDLEDGEMEGEI